MLSLEVERQARVHRWVGRAPKARVYIWLVFGHFGLINLVRGPSGE